MGGAGAGGGVGIKGGGLVTNYGVITGGQGGFNGAQKTGTGYGGEGVQLHGGDLINKGTITGGVSGDSYGGAGVTGGFGAGGLLNYGLIAGGRGVSGNGGYGVVAGGGNLVNRGTIAGGNSNNGLGGVGVKLQFGAVLTNQGTIDGGYSTYRAGGVGVQVGGGLLTNFGVIAGGDGGGFGDGVGVTLDGTLVNRGLIRGGGGAAGVVTSFAYASRIENAGTIEGLNNSVVFNSNRDVLVADAGAQFIGAIVGGGGTFELAGGTGVISGLGRNGKLSGDDGATFSGFGTYLIGAGGHWSLSGTNALGTRQSLTVDSGLIVEGSLREATGATVTIDHGGALRFQGSGQTLAGSIVNQGLIAVQRTTLAITGPVSGDGRAHIDDGTLAVASALTWNVAFTGVSGVLDLGQSRNFVGAISNFAAGGRDVLDLGDIEFVNAGEATFSGDTSGGTLTVMDGTNTASIRLIGNYLGDTFVAASDGQGGVTVTAMAAGPPSPHALVAAMAGLGAAGAMSHVLAEAHTHDRPMLFAPRSQRV